MKPTAKFGTATAVNLYYKSAGTHYLLHFPFGYKIVDGHPLSLNPKSSMEMARAVTFSG